MHGRFLPPTRLLLQLALAASCWLFAFAPTSQAGLGSRPEADLSNPEVAVETGKEAMDQSPAMPWYDAETDDFTTVNVKPPRPPVLSSTSGTSGSWNLFSFGGLIQLFGWLGLATLLAWLFYLISKAYLRRELMESESFDEQAPTSHDVTRIEELPLSLPSTVDNYLAEAERLYRAGDIAQAIVYLFSHQLLELDRRHWIRLVKGKTNRQYLREIRRSPASASTSASGPLVAGPLADSFGQTVLLFEEVFFGKRMPPKRQIESCWQQIATFESLVSQTVERAA